MRSATNPGNITLSSEDLRTAFELFANWSNASFPDHQGCERPLQAEGWVTDPKPSALHEAVLVGVLDCSMQQGSTLKSSEQ